MTLSFESSSLENSEKLSKFSLKELSFGFCFSKMSKNDKIWQKTAKNGFYGRTEENCRFKEMVLDNHYADQWPEF